TVRGGESVGKAREELAADCPTSIDGRAHEVVGLLVAEAQVAGLHPRSAMGRFHGLDDGRERQDAMDLLAADVAHCSRSGPCGALAPKARADLIAGSVESSAKL